MKTRAHIHWFQSVWISFRSGTRVLWWFLFILLFSGCKDRIQSANYVGNLSLYSIPNVADIPNDPVEVEVVKSKQAITLNLLRIDDMTSHLIQPISLSSVKKRRLNYKNVALTIPDLSPEPFLLKTKVSKESLCFSNHSFEYSIDLCFTERHISLDVLQNGSLKILFFGRLFEPHVPVQAPDVPPILTVKDAVQIAFGNNDDLLQEEQKVVQASEALKRAYFSLLPHLSISPIFIASTNIAGFFDFGGRLAPFLVPSRWFDTTVCQLQASVAALAATILKLNTAASIHYLAIHHVLNCNMVSDLKILHAELRQVIDFMKQNENKYEDIDSKLEVIQVLIDNVEFLIRTTEDLNDEVVLALANLLGIKDGGNIKQVALSEETPSLEEIPVLEADPLEQEKRRLAMAAISNSYEVRQHQELKRVAVLNEKTIYFKWIGDSDDIPLGLNLIPEKRIARSVTLALDLKIEAIRKKLNVSVCHLLQERNEWKTFYSMAKSTVELRRKRWTAFLKDLIGAVDPDLEPSSPNVPDMPNMDDMKHLVEDVMDGLTCFYSTSAIVHMMQAELDRVSLQGMYVPLLRQLGREEGSPDWTHDE